MFLFHHFHKLFGFHSRPDIVNTKDNKPKVSIPGKVVGLYHHGPYPPKMLPGYDLDAQSHTVPDDIASKPPMPNITITTPSIPLSKLPPKPNITITAPSAPFPKLEKLSLSPNFISGNHLKDLQSSIGPMENRKVKDWDGWPNGEWSYQFTHSEYEALNKLSVYWATIVLNGDKHHDINSLTLDGGKYTKCKCLGIIHCKNPDCDIVIQPQTRDAGVQKQLKYVDKEAIGLLEHEMFETSKAAGPASFQQ
ncbi:hypothetical protein BU17DRAFT_66375 [Hysterangium stoloniferum]|nr:hypothetical protein BU17DRAFT_66375 [Hysterangium stoloniferum]